MGDSAFNDRQAVIDRRHSQDEVDIYPEGCRVTNWDIIVLLVSILSHIIDVALDINVAYRYLQDGKTAYFALTVVFILFPAFVNTFVSVRMYVLSEDTTSSSRMAVKKWTIRIFVLLFQLAPVMRYCDSLDYALKSRRAEKRNQLADQRRYYRLMLKEDSDVALLRVFECFLEAAPQQILQIAIVLVDRGRGSTYQLLHQFGSIISSLLSMAWSMASYHRSIRLCQLDKSNLSWSGTAVQFLWHFCVTVSRILSISCVASKFPLAVGTASLVHWSAMTVWLATFERTQFSGAGAMGGGGGGGGAPTPRARLLEVVFCSILGLVYIFTYLTPSEGSTRNRYLVYYPICFVENVGAMAVWASSADPDQRQSWYFAPLLVSGLAPFAAGVLFMLLYYRCFHPETSRKVAAAAAAAAAASGTSSAAASEPDVATVVVPSADDDTPTATDT